MNKYRSFDKTSTTIYEIVWLERQISSRGCKMQMDHIFKIKYLYNGLKCQF